MLAAGGTEMIGNAWQLFDHRLLFGKLRVENTQRIRLDASLAVGSEFTGRGGIISDFLQLLAQQFDVLPPALLAANGIEVQRRIFKRRAPEKHQEHFKNFGVDG